MADYVLSAKGTYDGSDFDSGVEKSKSKLSGFMEQAQTVASRVKSAIGDGVAKTAEIVTGTIGTIGAGIGTLAATGGITRALNMEKAQTMFKGLKLDWNDYKNTINEAVDGTAFSMDAAALVAANLAASGVSAGQDMEKALNGATGVAATFGADLGDIGSIFQKVAAQGKLTGETLAQMSDRGINGLSVLSEYLGKSQAEVRDMVKSGKIDFQTFSDAMYSAFGDSAKGANDTFAGVTANIRANVAKIGEIFATPALKGLQQVFAALLPCIKSVRVALQPLADTFAAWIEGVVPKAVEVLTKLNDKIKELGEGGFGNLPKWVAPAAAAIGILSVGAMGSLISQIPVVGGLLGGLCGVIGKLSNPVALVRGAMSGLTSVFGGISAPVIAVVALIAALVGAFVQLMVTNEGFRNSIMETVGSIVSSLQPAFQSLMGLLPAFQTLWQAIMSVVESLAPVILNLVAAIAPVVSTIISSAVPVISTLIEILSSLVTQIAQFVAPIIQMIADLISAVMPQIQQIITTAMQLIQQVIETVWPIIQTIITTVMAAIQAVIETVWPIIQTVIETVLGVIQGIIDTVMALIQGNWEGVWNGILGIVQTVWNGITSIISTVAQIIVGLISGLVDAVVGFFGNLWSNVTSTVSNLWNTVTSTFSSGVNSAIQFASNLLNQVVSFFGNLWSNVTSTVSNMWNSVTSAFSSGVNSAISFVSELPGRIMGIFADAGSWLIDSGRAIIQGLIDGISGMIDAAVGAVGGVLDAIGNLLPHSPAKEGPFSGRGWTLYSGRSIVDALAEGAKEKTSKAVAAFRGVASKLRDSIDVGTMTYDYEVNMAAFLSDYPDLSYGIDVNSSNDGTEIESGINSLRSEVIDLKKSLGKIIADNAPVVVETERQAARRVRGYMYA